MALRYRSFHRQLTKWTQQILTQHSTETRCLLKDGCTHRLLSLHCILWFLLYLWLLLLLPEPACKPSWIQDQTRSPGVCWKSFKRSLTGTEVNKAGRRAVETTNIHQKSISQISSWLQHTSQKKLCRHVKHFVLTCFQLCFQCGSKHSNASHSITLDRIWLIDMNFL